LNLERVQKSVFGGISLISNHSFMRLGMLPSVTLLLAKKSKQLALFNGWLTFHLPL